MRWIKSLYLLGSSYNVNQIGNIKIISKETYNKIDIFQIINDIQPTILILPSIFDETWSYTFSICLKTGLPIFYNEIGAYRERMKNLNRTNSSSFNASTETTHQITDRLIHLIKYIKQKGSINYIDSDIEYQILSTYFYDKLYLRDNFEFKSLIDNIDNKLETIYLKYRDTYISISDKIKLFAIYFPQFHNAIENDINFEKNYTDFTSLKKIMNGQMPQKYTDDILTPLDTYIDYYDVVLDNHILDRQIKVAKSYGIQGFMFYHYWFTKSSSPYKNKVLYKPLEKLLLTADHDFHFFLCWSNIEWENLRGGPLLTTQNYNNNREWIEHFNYLLQFFKHKNYLKIDNKPVFDIHNPTCIEKNTYNMMISTWNDLAKNNGFDGIYLLFNITYSKCPEKRTYDSIVLHTPLHHGNSFIHSSDSNNNIVFYDNQQLINMQFQENYLSDGNDYIITFYNSFDNCARLLAHPHRKRSKFINNQFEQSLDSIFNIYKKYTSKSRIFLINAWNEWGENMSIEPSNEHQFHYLEIIQKQLIKHFSKKEVMSQLFTQIYDKGIWAWGQKESKSGGGSTIEQTKFMRPQLEQLLIDLNINTILDASLW